jgi:hypothetical protein
MNTQMNAIVAHEHIQDLLREAEQARISLAWARGHTSDEIADHFARVAAGGGE